MKSKCFIILTILMLSFPSLQAQVISKFVDHGGLTRQYFVYVPEIYTGYEPVPLVFNFHGWTGLAFSHMAGTQMMPVADTANFILVAPQGSLFNGNSHWNVGAWTVGTTADDIGFTEVMIDSLTANYNIDLERIYSCGYSNGGYFSFELACQLSDRIAAIGSVGGKMSSETYNACNPAHPTPVVTIHGTADNVVSYLGSQPSGSKTVAETNAYWANFNNTDNTAIIESLPDLNTADGSTVEYHTFKNGDICTLVDHYKVIDDGHNWPGAWGNQDIHASRIIWEFVSQYDINGRIICNSTSTTDTGKKKDEIVLYPNPSNDWVTIQKDIDKTMDCEIYNLKGELVSTAKVSPSNKTIDISELPGDIYFLKIEGDVFKVIKTK